MIDHDRYRVLLADGQGAVAEGAVAEGFERVRGREAVRVIERALSAPHAHEWLLNLYRRNAPDHLAYPRMGAPVLVRARAWLTRMVDHEPMGIWVLRRSVPTPGLLPEPIPVRPPGPQPSTYDEVDWIEIELLDQDGEPFIGTPFSIAKGEDVVAQGALNRFGSAYIDRIDPGSYNIVIGRATEDAPLEPSDWLIVELMYETGVPAAGERFVITDVSGVAREGQLDAHGRAVLFDVAPGECTVSFPGLAAS